MQSEKRLLLSESWLFLVILGGLIILLYFLGYRLISLIPFVLLLFCLYFFRNPPREIMAGEREIVAPADGLILKIEEVQEERYLKGKAIKISIFLSIFDVHVNRMPLAGRIEFLAAEPGRFLPAYKTEAAQLNERNYVGIRSDEEAAQAVLLVQIAGIIARRIVCWAKLGEQLKQGALLGMIKFGSCTELYLPEGTSVFVREGQKVRGGETIMGRFANHA